MTPFHLVVVCLLFSSQLQGSTAVTPVFVQMGKDVLLEVNQTVTLNEKTDFIWKCNNSRILKFPYGQKVVIFDPYNGRAELNTQSYSLLLKNLQHNDSGGYVAALSAGTDQTITEYKVSVEEPVSPVKLTVVSHSSDPCNITVTCSTVNSHITKTFTCDNQTCSHQGGGEATPTYDSISVTVQEGVMICNHSNHVSWTNDRLDIKTYCGSQKGTSNAASIIGPVISVVVACLIVIVIWHKCKRPIEKQSSENTIYAIPQDIIPAKTQIEAPAEDVSTTSPTSTYAFVQFHTGPGQSNSTNTSSPETVYAQVERDAKSNSRPLSSTNT